MVLHTILTFMGINVSSTGAVRTVLYLSMYRLSCSYYQPKTHIYFFITVCKTCFGANQNETMVLFMRADQLCRFPTMYIFPIGGVVRSKWVIYQSRLSRACTASRTVTPACHFIVKRPW